MSAHSNITKEKYPFIKMRIIEIAWKPILRAFCPMVSWGSNLLSPPPIPFLNPALGQGMWKPTLLLLSTISLMFSHQVVSNSLDCSPSGSSVHGISQARTLEWIAIFFSRESSWPRDQTYSPALDSLPLWNLGSNSFWTQLSHMAGRFFTLWVIREAPLILYDTV